MMRWRITIQQWPFSTGASQAKDQAAAGDRELYFYVTAQSFAEAVKMAKCFQEGVQRNPAVWQAPIYGVHVWPPSSPEPESKEASHG
ncbi:MAG: hypothetical protein K2X46_02905 [Roseomonas sp.]|nr:hypothetical protein [Roseomonas sp.]